MRIDMNGSVSRGDGGVGGGVVSGGGVGGIGGGVMRIGMRWSGMW